jgi:hypothetical protein
VKRWIRSNPLGAAVLAALLLYPLYAAAQVALIDGSRVVQNGWLAIRDSYLRVGLDGVPDVALTKGGVYIEGKLEVDGDALFDGDVVFTGSTNLGLSEFGTGIIFEGATANDFETTLTVVDPTADRTIKVPDLNGTVLLSNGLPGELHSIRGVNSGFEFEGATADAFETTLVVADPTADRTITLPDASGTVMITGQPVIIQSGAAPAATCTVGEIFLDTDETDDDNCATTADNSLCLCVASNTWVSLENN